MHSHSEHTTSWTCMVFFNSAIGLSLASSCLQAENLDGFLRDQMSFPCFALFRFRGLVLYLDFSQKDLNDCSSCRGIALTDSSCTFLGDAGTKLTTKWDALPPDLKSVSAHPSDCTDRMKSGEDSRRGSPTGQQAQE